MAAPATPVSVTELRNKFGMYLQRVAVGERFNVTVRGKAIAEFCGPNAESTSKPGVRL